MGLDLDYIDGQTPLDEDEKEGLLIPTIATRSELDEFEQQNIEQAIAWSLRRSFKADNVFTEHFLRTVHERMYGNVWAWAGEYRRTNKNIGVDKWQIPTALRTLLDDVKYWYANGTYSPDECTIRFKHRLVSIHCFPNGNGRHSRLMADIVIQKIFKHPIYTWGAANLVKQGDPRAAYLKAIGAADAGDIKPLIDFARA
ncbi:mobile mystery protein B [Dinghuibacter silviterrae]|uniref:Fic-DOC domain mobile mystery protein B n=1 Tax=Dinghuibacter silviterrae TaxID=1539049 RepID=A0A4R8DFK6_9BACT|nr:mobile mystery protein B [Dinghuibacter silviterrae]TDW96108.1 Fic-DOC domain mobile mystery protein B [Dinghuibacter silviterrae]